MGFKLNFKKLISFAGVFGLSTTGWSLESQKAKNDPKHKDPNQGQQNESKTLQTITHDEQTPVDSTWVNALSKLVPFNLFSNPKNMGEGTGAKSHF